MGQYKVMTYVVVDAHTLQVTVQCNSTTSPTGTFDMYYTVGTLNGATSITLTTAGSSDVLAYQ